MRETCTYDSAMNIGHIKLVEEEKKPIGVRKSEARRSEDRVFPLMEERKSTRIGLTNPAIREEGSSQIRSDQEVINKLFN